MGYQNRQLLKYIAETVFWPFFNERSGMSKNGVILNIQLLTAVHDLCFDTEGVVTLGSRVLVCDAVHDALCVAPCITVFI